MITKEEAVARIAGQLEKKKRVVVALDGMSCSGKTTFAQALAEKFSGSVVHMDDFFLPRDRFTEEMQSLPGGNIDRARFKAEVLEPLTASRDFAYRPFSCEDQVLLPDPVKVAGRLVVVEGAYALLPDWGRYWDLALFLQVSTEEQQGRLLLTTHNDTLEISQRFFSSNRNLCQIFILYIWYINHHFHPLSSPSLSIHTYSFHLHFLI